MSCSDPTHGRGAVLERLFRRLGGVPCDPPIAREAANPVEQARGNVSRVAEAMTRTKTSLLGGGPSYPRSSFGGAGLSFPSLVRLKASRH
jgi:hypothetical protein